MSKPVTIRVGGYVKVRCIFDEGDALLQLNDLDADYTFEGDMLAIWHMVHEIAVTGETAFRQRHLDLLQHHACRSLELEERLARMEAELSRVTKLLKITETVKEALVKQLENHIPPREVDVVRERARERCRRQHPELF